MAGKGIDLDGSPAKLALVGYDSHNGNTIEFILRDDLLIRSLIRSEGVLPDISRFWGGSRLTTALIPDAAIPRNAEITEYQMDVESKTAKQKPPSPPSEEVHDEVTSEGSGLGVDGMNPRGFQGNVHTATPVIRGTE